MIKILKTYIQITILYFLVFACVPVTPTSTNTPPINKKLELIDKTYEPFIKTVKLYPNLNTVTQDMEAPVVSLARYPGLTLEFDALVEDYLALQARIIHCNADWTQSRLSDIEFLSEYNVFDLTQFDYSQNTKTLYANYRFQIPKPKVSGNFVVAVYQNNNQNDLLLTKRFALFEDKIAVKPTIGLSTGVMSRDFNQQIEFSLNYKGLDISNPLTDLFVVIRQNQRWDNSIQGLNPTQVREERSEVEYRHFNLENNFKGGNEFRFFDLRQYSFRGQNIAFINKDSNPIQVQVVHERTRADQAYAQFRDLNGNYFIETKEAGAGYLETDYMNVKFRLRSPEALSSPIFVMGAFNDWQKDKENKMKYDPTLGEYSGELLLKQGFYNYLYYVDDPNGDPYAIEGSFYQTENQYDILVYFRPLGTFTERLVGYRSFRTEF